jgi:hypothetical protein
VTDSTLIDPDKPSPTFLERVQNEVVVRYYLRVDNAGTQVFFAELLAGEPGGVYCNLQMSVTMGRGCLANTPVTVWAPGGDERPLLRRVLESWKVPRPVFPHLRLYLQNRAFVGLIELGSSVTRQAGPEQEAFQMYHGLIFGRLVGLEPSVGKDLLVQRFNKFIAGEQRSTIIRTFGTGIRR